MSRFVVGVIAASLLVACDPNSTPSDAGSDAAMDGRMPDAGTPDAAPFDDERPATLSPLGCQTDLTVLRDEDFEIRQHPLDYKGEVYGIRQEGADLVLKALVSDAVLARSGQMVTGLGDLTLAFDNTFIAVAPDHGTNDPDDPLAFNVQMRGSMGIGTATLLRSDGAGSLIKVIADGDSVNVAKADGTMTGTVSGFEQVRVAADGSIFFVLQFDEHAGQFLVRDRGAGTSLALVVGAGTTLDDTRAVGAIESYDLTPLESPTVRVAVMVGTAQVGFAYVRAAGGGQTCLLTDTPLACVRGIRMPAGESVPLEDFSSDGLSTGAVFRGNPSSPSFHYRVSGPAGDGAPAVIERGVETQGFSFNNFKFPRTCGRDGSLYFVGQLVDAGTHDELMRLDARGALSQLTDFGSLLASDALVGEVPDEILGLALGSGCDAVMRTKGSPSGAGSTTPYEGYWVSYFGGDTMEIVDETPGRAGNGNGPMLTGLVRGRSGIDPNAEWNTPVNIGPAGEFTFLAQRPTGVRSTYARSTRPRDRCRAPNVVNSDGDADDLAPGDGRCDTGMRIGSDPECTLRAVIQETNANPGSDLGRSDVPRTIRLTSPLPPVTSALVFEGISTVVNGADLVGDEVGLEILVRGVELHGISFEHFPSHGIRATKYVILEDVSATSNCGWGMWLEAGATITGTASAPARVEDNGAGDACTAGGIFLANADVPTRITDVRANANDGPGIASAGRIDTAGLEVSDNRGDGITYEHSDSVGVGLDAAIGTILARNNGGHGIAMRGGGIQTEVANVVAEGNCGWGLWLENAPARLESSHGRMPGMRHVMSNNGLTRSGGGTFWSLDASGSPVSTSRRCGGGGISVTELQAGGFNTLSRIDSVDIEENQGPGIASSAGWRISDATIRANFGPGVIIAEDPGDDPISRDERVITFSAGRPASVVTENLSLGIDVAGGSVDVEGQLLVEANFGAGIGVGEGDVTLNINTLGLATTLRRNGILALTCRPWTNTAEGWLQGDEAPCRANGGVFVEVGNITAIGPIVRDNAGPGLSASDPDLDGYGIVDVSLGEVCGNGAPDVAEMFNYTMVTTMCM